MNIVLSFPVIAGLAAFLGGALAQHWIERARWGLGIWTATVTLIACGLLLGFRFVP